MIKFMNMENSLIYRLFTVSDLKEWLFHNVNNGLSDAVIARPRALAFINNPHAIPEDAALAVVYNEKGSPIGYTGAFPEQWVRPSVKERYFWGSTQWMDPQYRGKGVSARMMRQIKDAVDDKYIALDSSAASCRLDEKQGSVISYYSRYFFRFKSKGNGIKSKLKEKLVRINNERVLSGILKIDYANNYVNYIDDETYKFIENHSKRDLFLRKQDYLNWQLRNPFLLASFGDKKLRKETCEFGGRVGNLQLIMVQVYVKDQLCGFYVLNIVNDRCSVLYLYYEDSYSDYVFASLVSNVLRRNKIAKFSTFDKELFDFMIKCGVKSMFSKNVVDMVSLTIPADFIVDKNLRIQGGDGDMVC